MDSTTATIPHVTPAQQQHSTMEQMPSTIETVATALFLLSTGTLPSYA
jgi:hypothetical protein